VCLGCIVIVLESCQLSCDILYSGCLCYIFSLDVEVTVTNWLSTVFSIIRQRNRKVCQTSIIGYLLANFSISIAPGCYGKLMGMWECPRGVYPVTMVFLDMLLTLIKAHWDEKWNSYDLLAGVCLTAQDIYSNQHKWRFTSVYDQQLIGNQP